LHGLLDDEVAETVTLYHEWGDIDRSHRKLAHRGSYLERVWVSPSSVRRVLAAQGLFLNPPPRAGASARQPFPEWVEYRPNQIWIYDTTHFGRAKSCLTVVQDLVSRKWVADILSSEETSTQVEIVFTDALEAEGLLALVETRADGLVDPRTNDEARPILLRGEEFVTVIIDLNPVCDGAGPERLLDMGEGQSKQVFKTWLEAQKPALRDRFEILAMDGFTCFKTAAAEEIPDGVAVVDSFHVVAMAAMCWTPPNASRKTPAGNPGRRQDPLYDIRRVLRIGVGLLRPTHPAYSPPLCTRRSRRPRAPISASRPPTDTARRWGAGYSTGPARPMTRPGASTPQVERLRGTALSFRNLTVDRHGIPWRCRQVIPPSGVRSI
jgi:hypothetical protein